jgi:DNA-binding NarL/FixJ family response regulator
MEISDFSLIIISTITTASSLVIAIALAIKLNSQKKFTLSQLADLEIKLSRFQQDIDTLSKKDVEQAGKIAWLESRVRSGASAVVTSKEDSFEDNLSAATSTPAKLSLTERRHRILSLARRGLDTNAISNMLGTPHGEVELIIGLNRAIV